jgi:hypothetical protein
MHLCLSPPPAQYITSEVKTKLSPPPSPPSSPLSSYSPHPLPPPPPPVSLPRCKVRFTGSYCIYVHQPTTTSINYTGTFLTNFFSEIIENRITANMFRKPQKKWFNFASRFPPFLAKHTYVHCTVHWTTVQNFLTFNIFRPVLPIFLKIFAFFRTLR